MENSTLIMGSMYSGKSEELKRLIKRNEIAGKKCDIFKPTIDDRYSKNHILTHENAKILNIIDSNSAKKVVSKILGISAYNIKSPNEIFDYIDNNTQVVGIDEVQFFDETIIDVVEELNKRNIKVIMSGLDMYSNGDIFEVTAKLAAKCKYVQKLHAVCVDCGQEAAYSYKPSSDNEARIDIGSEGKYIALCEKCKEKRDN